MFIFVGTFKLFLIYCLFRHEVVWAVWVSSSLHSWLCSASLFQLIPWKPRKSLYRGRVLYRLWVVNPTVELAGCALKFVLLIVNNQFHSSGVANLFHEGAKICIEKSWRAFSSEKHWSIYRLRLGLFNFQNI